MSNRWPGRCSAPSYEGCQEGRSLSLRFSLSLMIADHAERNWVERRRARAVRWLIVKGAGFFPLRVRQQVRTSPNIALTMSTLGRRDEARRRKGGNERASIRVPAGRHNSSPGQAKRRPGSGATKTNSPLFLFAAPCGAANRKRGDELFGGVADPKAAFAALICPGLFSCCSFGAKCSAHGQTQAR